MTRSVWDNGTKLADVSFCSWDCFNAWHAAEVAKTTARLTRSEYERWKRRRK